MFARITGFFAKHHLLLLVVAIAVVGYCVLRPKTIVTDGAGNPK